MIDNCKAFIFDLDGTLIDTEKLYKIFWPQAVKDYGFTMTDEQRLALRSLGRPFVAEQMAEWFGPTFDYLEIKNHRKVIMEEYVREHGIDKMPGAIELLEALKQKGITIAIATATDPERATRYLRKAGISLDYFDKLISATEVPKGKPAPDIYLYACERLGLEPEDCIAVEDAPNGIRSAKAAGLKVIMVPDQAPATDDDSKYYDYCVKNLEEIISYL